MKYTKSSKLKCKENKTHEHFVFSLSRYGLKDFSFRTEIRFQKK